MGTDSIRVVIVDDHPIVRAGLRLVLDSACGIQVVAEGATGSEALHLAAEYHPDVLILDINLPDLNGIEVTRQLRSRDKTVAILALTVHNDSQTLFELLEVGINGYVLKDDALETLAIAIRAVAAGENWLSPGIARQVVRRAFCKETVPVEASAALTPRELEVLCLAARGFDNDAIAHQLILAKRTVQNHVSSIYGKLGVDTRAEAMLYAIRNHLVKLTFEGNQDE